MCYGQIAIGNRKSGKHAICSHRKNCGKSPVRESSAEGRKTERILNLPWTQVRTQKMPHPTCVRKYGHFLLTLDLIENREMKRGYRAKLK